MFLKVICILMHCVENYFRPRASQFIPAIIHPCHYSYLPLSIPAIIHPCHFPVPLLCMSYYLWQLKPNNNKNVFDITFFHFKCHIYDYGNNRDKDCTLSCSGALMVEVTASVLIMSDVTGLGFSS